MPLPGQGAVPTGALYNELTAVTRRAFVPRLFVQIYFATPTLFYLLGGAQKAAGGLSQVTIPAQMNSMVQGQHTGYGGGFNAPIVTPGIQNAQFPLVYWVVPVPLPFGENVIQATEREISLLKARMNDVWAVTVQTLGSLIFQNNTGDTLLPDSFVDGFDNGTNVPVYGGINRNAPGNSAWQGQYYTASASAGQPGLVGFTYTTMATQIMRIIKGAASGGEAPTFVVMSMGDFATLSATITGTETVFKDPGQVYSMSTPIRAAFPNINVAGVPVYADYFCPNGTCFFVNSKYTSMFASEDAMFDFSGFYSLVPLGQIGQQGVVVTGYNFITSKPNANAIVTGISSAAF